MLPVRCMPDHNLTCVSIEALQSHNTNHRSRDYDAHTAAPQRKLRNKDGARTPSVCDRCHPRQV